MAYPIQGQKPWGADLKGYIDAADAASASASVPKVLYSAKGTILVATGAGTPAALPVGASGRQIFVDPTTPTGLRYSAAGELPLAGDVFSTGNVNTVLTPGTYLCNGGAANLPIPGTGFLTVRKQNTGTNIQQEYAIQGTQRIFYRVSSNTGSTWGSWAEIRMGSPIAGNTITGTGSPEGVVSAPPLVTYKDTAVTNGAAVWEKITGSGNTGWKVVYGDTGWRNINMDAAFGSDGKSRIRRIGGTVSIGVAVKPTFSSTVPAGTKIIDIPSGFRGPGGVFGTWGVTTANLTRLFTANVSTLTMNGSNVLAGDDLFMTLISYPTSDPWPTGSLPGTAA